MDSELLWTDESNLPVQDKKRKLRGFINLQAVLQLMVVKRGPSGVVDPIMRVLGLST
jgi:hypothetical protein